MKQLVNNIFRYLRLYTLLVRLSVMEVTAYRANSLLLGLAPVVWMLTTIAFVAVIFKETREIGGWRFWEVMLLLGVHEFIFLATWMTFCRNLNGFISFVRQGKFDRTLLRPVNHRFFVSFNAIDLTSLGSLVNVIIVLSVSLTHLDIKIGFNLLLFFVSLISAYLIAYFVYFSVASLCLFFIKADSFTEWLLEMTDFDRFPAEIYSDFFRFFLLFGLPMLFFAYVPTAILLNKLSGYFVALGIVVIFWLYLISTIIWRKGLKNYQSASS